MKTPNENGHLVPFQISFRTFDKSRNTGGKMRAFAEALICTNVPSGESVGKAARKPEKNPGHNNHKTFNIELMVDGVATGHIRKVHSLFVTQFNGQPVHL